MEIILYDTLCAMVLVTNGASIPGIVAIEFVIPKSIPAYCGAMSTWFMRKPAEAIALKPTDRERRDTATISLEPMKQSASIAPADNRKPIVIKHEHYIK